MSLGEYVAKQAEAIFPDGYNLCPALEQYLPRALQRTTQCVHSVKSWQERGFDYLVSGQYAIFLYFLANEIWRASSDSVAATKLFLLNKVINGIDLYYEVELPPYFLIGHTVGMVFAKATYANFLVLHQGCTIGRSGDERPRLEPGIVLFPNASIIGRCLVKENTVIAPGVQLVNHSTPGNCYVFMGKSGKPVFKDIDEYFADRYFDRCGIAD